MKTQANQALSDTPFSDTSFSDRYESYPTEIQFGQLDLKEISENELEIRKALQICSILFEYPDQGLNYTLVESSIEELNNTQVKEMLTGFWQYYKQKDFIEQAQEYVTTFDINPSASLYLTSGEDNQDKNRGMALLHMKEVYNQNGFTLKSRELPDYFPVYLEFLSIAPMAFIKTALNTQAKSINNLASTLRNANSPYKLVMDACLVALGELLEDKEVFR